MYNKVMVVFALFLGFVVGALVVIGVEVACVFFLIRKLGDKEVKEDVKPAKFVRDELQFPFPNKQGWVWILEKIPKTLQPTDKHSRQQKRKFDIFEVTPVKKQASIKDKSLIITEPDGTLTKIYLLGCTAEAVSATNLPTRKWAKKYPLKVENKSSEIYHGSKVLYMYFETSCEKESWCKALRLASCDDKEKLIWFYRLRREFHSYLASLNVEYPSFLKPTIGYNPEIGDRFIKVDGSSSKVRHFLRKLTKKASKIDRKISENPVGGSSKGSVSQAENKSNYGGEEKVIQAIVPRSIPSGSRNLGAQSCDLDSNDKVSIDDGTLCCNLLISRLFFDAKSNVDLRNSIQAQIQRTLSAARTPSYVGEIICTGVNPGVIPPYIHGMRVLPSDLKEVVAMEIDLEYYGGAVLDIETRLEVQELKNRDSKSVDDVTTDLLEGFEYYGEQLKLNEQANQSMEPKNDEKLKLEETKSFKGNEQASSTIPKWKSVINSVAKQVSQVPLSLAIRVTSLRGTLRVHIKPPPSDQIWFGFTSMPDVEFSLESAVGDHKITSGHIALFIISKFKAAIRETMVLPNCESATIPFMSAEANDWIPLKSAPFIWTNPESTTEPPIIPEHHHPQPPDDENQPQDTNTSSTHTTHNNTPSNQSDDENPTTATDDKSPSLETHEHHPSPPQEATSAAAVAAVAKVVEEENREVEVGSLQHLGPGEAAAVVAERAVVAEDGKLKRMGTRARMMGLRKRMGEKLEEKRRNIEERGRHMVEKMRGPAGGGGI